MRYLSCGGVGRRYALSVGDMARWSVDGGSFDTHTTVLDLPHILNLVWTLDFTSWQIYGP